MKKDKTIMGKRLRRNWRKLTYENLPKKKNLLGGVFAFRWLKRAMVGKSQEESLDLLDRWILKKR